VVSFGTRDLPWVVDYVRNQESHHSSRTVQDRLERIEQDDDVENPVKTGCTTEKSRVV